MKPSQNATSSISTLMEHVSCSVETQGQCYDWSILVLLASDWLMIIIMLTSDWSIIFVLSSDWLAGQSVD